MVRRNLMIAVLAKQRMILNALVDQLSDASQDEDLNCLFCTRQAELVSDNLRKWIAIQRNYDSGRTMNRMNQRLDNASTLADSFLTA